MTLYREFTETSPFFGGNGVFIEQMQARYLADPSSVDPTWREFFATLGEREAARRASWANGRSAVIGVEAPEEARPAKEKTKANGKAAAASAIPAAQPDLEMTRDSVRALMLIHAYRYRGHLIANLDPLGMEERNHHPELDPASYGFGPGDEDKRLYLGGEFGMEYGTLREVLNILRKTYCQTLGIEYMHIPYPEQKEWLQRHIESSRGRPEFSLEEKKEILENLIEVEAFEEFLQVKYAGVKRFSIQGGDSTIAGLQAAITEASRLGVEEIVLGMPHRGRMNVLTTVMGKPYAELLSIFHGNLDFPEGVVSSGDVKYHLGVSSDREMPFGKMLHLSLTANPSHLEVVNPVVCGKVRAKQDQLGDEEKRRVLGLMLHGDAAFAGQGSVAETLSLSELRGYRTGGSVHIIVNNQIGFTTAPKFSRFTPYPSDVAKMAEAPIFHVNGDDAEAVIYACRVATAFRQEFRRDVVVDIVCYRKYGHNEGDEPMYTQPAMYKRIGAKESPAKIYADQLVAEGAVTREEVAKSYQEFEAFFGEQYEIAKDFKPNKANWLEGQWSGFERAAVGERADPDTGVALETLKAIGKTISSWPEGFHVNRKLARILQARGEAIASGENLDWAAGEMLAFGSLLHEEYPVRLSGQDSARGTFSHRHSVLIDQETEERYIPLNHIGGKQKHYEVIDSSLSELAVLGFEYGYSLAEPKGLTLWEAQFGDFANGAQVIIDQFIASGEIKWLRMSGLVMLLPHGYEGQGPEHSSARLERFLQLCGEDNMQIANCTTPANYFHILRRQMHRKFRKPLVIMTPKSLLRHKLAVSGLAEMGPKTTFSKIYGEIDPLAADAKIRRVVFCSGKVYYELLQARRERKIEDTAIVRIEQLYPFPQKEIREQLARYKNAEVVWCQEEPRNMGAWFFVEPRLREILEEMGRAARVGYAGRPEAASPAAGYLKMHEREQKALVAAAFTEEEKKRKIG